MSNNFKSGGYNFTFNFNPAAGGNYSTSEGEEVVTPNIKAIPIEKFEKKKPESILAPNGRDVRNRPIESYSGLRSPNGKPLDEFFEVETITWQCMVQNREGVKSYITFVSGAGERKIRADNETIHNNYYTFL